MIVGSKIATATFEPQTEGEVLLRTHALSGRIAQDVTLELHRGEVLGLTGLMGMGHEEVPYLIFGAEPATGELELDGERMPISEMSPRRAIGAGVALLPGDRQRASGAGTLSVQRERHPAHRSTGSSAAASCVPSASAPVCSSSCAPTTCAPPRRRASSRR